MLFRNNSRMRRCRLLVDELVRMLLFLLVVLLLLPDVSDSLLLLSTPFAENCWYYRQRRRSRSSYRSTTTSSNWARKHNGLVVVPVVGVDQKSTKCLHLAASSFSTTSADEENDNGNNKIEETEPVLLTSAITTTTATTTISDNENAEALHRQAEALRAEARDLEAKVRASKQAKKDKELADVDKWLNDLLVSCRIDDSTEMLNTVEQVTQKLQDGRYSPEQVDKIFERLCETCPTIRGRDSLETNGMLRLLIEASGKLDEIEREHNPNKRWNGKVERSLHKKLFAKEWGIDLEKTTTESSSTTISTGSSRTTRAD